EGAARRGGTPTKYFERTGIFESRVTAAHCTHVTAEDIHILAVNGVTAVHCPSSNLKLGSGIAPVPEMLSAGVTVALGTDGASSNNNLNMFEEMHLAGIIHRGVAMNPELTPASQILGMATESGAVGQGRQNTGAIAVGKCADLAMLNLDRPHLTPVHDILSSLVFAAQSGDVEMTVVDGEIVYKNGEFLKFDIFRAVEKAGQAAKRIASEVG
ncbi:MAG: amidohydrolase family protein, partial [Clostridiales bacterium]|nr:amidohydrolase family protein [Clostridiales bacterium]